jgi:hypothetical protein
VVLGDAVRLAIEALLLWAASEFAAMAIRSHDDLQATRILMARLIYRLAPPPDARRGDKTEAV